MDQMEMVEKKAVANRCTSHRPKELSPQAIWGRRRKTEPTVLATTTILTFLSSSSTSLFPSEEAACIDLLASCRVNQKPTDTNDSAKGVFGLKLLQSREICHLSPSISDFEQGLTEHKKVHPSCFPSPQPVPLPTNSAASRL